METLCYHRVMPKRLVPEAQIEEACRALFRTRRKVGVRDVARYLQELHGFKGRTERVAIVLKRVQEEQIALPSPPDQQPDQAALAPLLRQLREAERRAARAEELERRHQDFWADRYAEKLQELERRLEARRHDAPTVTPEQYLRVSQRVVELERRLAQYEGVEPFSS
jgi:hypothetical protein